MAAKAEERGLKRICTGCGVRFYDFAKRPVICPACNLEFTGEIKVKNRRARISIANDDGAEGQVSKKAVQDDEDEEDISEDEDVISLDDVDTIESSDDDDDDIPGTDLDLDDDDLEDLEDNDLDDLDALDDEDLDEVDEDEERNG